MDRHPGTTVSRVLWRFSALLQYAQEIVKITLNGDPFELSRPVTVDALLRRLEIDSRRVAVEYNLAVLKRAAYESTIVSDGDKVEIVNFVGGG